MKRSFLFRVVCPIAALAMAFACEKPSAGDGNDDTGTVTGEGDGGEQITYTLSVNPMELDFGCRASDAPQTFTVTTNVPDGFILSVPEQWYTVSQNGDKVTVTVSDNTGDARSHELIVSAEGVEPVTVTISQDKCVALSLSVNPMELDFGCRASDAPQTFTVTTNVPDGFTLSAPEQWYTVSQNGDKVTVTVSDNTGDARSHELIVSAEGVEPVTVTISQDKCVASSLSGEKYIVWFLDAASREELGDKIIADLGIFGLSIAQIQEYWGSFNVASELEDSGFYGQTGNYMGLSATNGGWSNAYYEYKANDDIAIDLNPIWKEITDDNGKGWYFHIAVKGDGTNKFYLYDGADEGVDRVEVVNTNIENLAKYNAETWTEIEVPMTELINKGWVTGVLNGTTLSIDGGGGTERNHYDALFIYKK